MQAGSWAVGGNQLGERIKDAALVAWVSLEAGVAECLVETAAVLAGGSKRPVDVLIGNGLRLVWQAGWL